MNTDKLLLGKHTAYLEEYDPTILQPIARSLGRKNLTCDTSRGFDLWRLYEVTYLNRQGIPQVALGSIKVPADSPFIVESKSLKLYIGSFTQTKFSSLSEVIEVIKHDLNQKLKTSVECNLFSVQDEKNSMQITALDGDLIDNEPVNDIVYTVNPKLLRLNNGPIVKETLKSNLLRTLCPVTGQPDHASVMISYEGAQIDRSSLLSYLISFRHHQGFHEQCCEQIFNDIKQILKPAKLAVTACFTRRGGIDINPIRSEFDDIKMPVRTIRQ